MPPSDGHLATTISAHRPIDWDRIHSDLSVNSKCEDGLPNYVCERPKAVLHKNPYLLLTLLGINSRRGPSPILGTVRPSKTSSQVFQVFVETLQCAVGKFPQTLRIYLGDLAEDTLEGCQRNLGPLLNGLKLLFRFVQLLLQSWPPPISVADQELSKLFVYLSIGAVLDFDGVGGRVMS